MSCRQRSKDEARDTFKMLRSQLIGETAAGLYAEWAALEHAAGNREKASTVLRKGLAAGAAPARRGVTEDPYSPKDIFRLALINQMSSEYLK